MPKVYIVEQGWKHALMRMNFGHPDMEFPTVNNPVGEEALMAQHHLQKGSSISYFFYGFLPEEVRPFFACDEDRRRRRYPFRVDLVRVQFNEYHRWHQMNLRPPEGVYLGDRLTIHHDAKPKLKGKFIGARPLCIAPYHLVHTNDP